MAILATTTILSLGWKRWKEWKEWGPPLLLVFLEPTPFQDFLHRAAVKSSMVEKLPTKPQSVVILLPRKLLQFLRLPLLSSQSTTTVINTEHMEDMDIPQLQLRSPSTIPHLP